MVDKNTKIVILFLNDCKMITQGEKEMKKITVFTLMLLMAAGLSFAGDNNSNQSTGYVRSLNRNSVMNNIDAVVYNPAGTTELEKGFHFALQNQFLLRNYSYDKKPGLPIPSKPLKVNVPDGESDDNTYIFPSAMVDYTGNNWAAFFAFGAPGGGGSVSYKPYARTSLAVFTKKNADAGTSASINLKAESQILGYSLGGAYNFFDMVSVSAVLRLLQANQKINAKVVTPVTIKLKDTEHKALGVSALFGLNVTPVENLNIAMRYELPTKLEYSSDDNGAKDYRHDFPAILGFGVGYNVLPQLRLMADFNWNFYKQQAENIDGMDADDINEPWSTGIAAEYNITDRIMVSAGYNYTDSRVTKESMTSDFNGLPVPNANPDLARNVLGLGGEWEIIDGLKLELGYMAVIYSGAKDNHGIHYNKAVHDISVGASYHF